MELSFEAWPGTLGPVAGTPDRRPGWVRRTTSILAIGRPTIKGSFHFLAAGRDVRDDEILDEATVELRTDGWPPMVSALDIDGGSDRGAAVLGTPLLGGFRRNAAVAVVPDEGSVLALLLDDLPAAAIVSGSGPVRAEVLATGELPAGMLRRDVLPANVCAGKRLGAVMDQRRQAGRPLLGQGPPAGVLDRPDDPLAWVPTPPMTPWSVRRLRRIDVGVVGDEVVVDTLFRDSAMEPDGVETSMHEYEVLVTAGLVDRVVRTAEVRARVLPGPDCPAAVDSAQRIVGQRLDDLRSYVRGELVGETTCIHLNDQLRSLADVPLLLTSVRT
jgi:hypothetical protein